VQYRGNVCKVQDSESAENRTGECKVQDRESNKYRTVKVSGTGQRDCKVQEWETARNGTGRLSGTVHTGVARGRENVRFMTQVSKEQDKVCAR